MAKKWGEDTKYEYLEQGVTIKIKDKCSGHIWKYEIDNINPCVHIFKNDDHKRTLKEVVTPISIRWLEEIREGL